MASGRGSTCRVGAAGLCRLCLSHNKANPFGLVLLSFLPCSLGTQAVGLLSALRSGMSSGGARAPDFIPREANAFLADRVHLRCRHAGWCTIESDLVSLLSSSRSLA